MSNYGRFIISSGEIPAGSDAGTLFPVFSSGSKCTAIHFVQYYGGDSGEFAQLVLIPPTITINGTTAPSDHAGTIALTSMGYMQGAFAVEDGAAALNSDNGGRGPPSFVPFIIPPNYQIAVMQNTANTAAWSVTVGGFELNA